MNEFVHSMKTLLENNPKNGVFVPTTKYPKETLEWLERLGLKAKAEPSYATTNSKPICNWRGGLIGFTKSSKKLTGYIFYKMKDTAVILIEKERNEQQTKHGKTTKIDVIENPNGELIQGAKAIIDGDLMAFPSNWKATFVNKMVNKPLKERLVIAAALLAAEIDRLQYLEDNTNQDTL